MVIQLKLIRMVKSLAYDVGLKLSDAEYLVRRLKSEGLRFLTVTLPALESCVLKSLEKGIFQRPTSIAWRRRSLEYFQVLLNHIFDPITGECVSLESTATALKRLRQLCSYFYKLAVSFEDDQIVEAITKYSLLEWTELQNSTYDKDFVNRMRKLLHTLFKEYTDAHLHQIFSAVEHTRFGPGSFFGSENHKDPFAVYKLRAERHIGTCSKSLSPYAGFFRSPLSRRGGRPSVHLCDERRVCQVLFVPKDSRGPRVISKEPLHMLRAQLAYFDWATALLERKTNGAIQFKDQTGNQELAKEASITRKFVTADLSSASDRVRYDVCSQLFANCIGVRELITKYRSTSAVIAYPPDAKGKILKQEINLSKLAGMGSGLTFPTMALVIYLATFTAIRDFYISVDVTPPDANEFHQGFRVYGDDVIVRTEWYSHYRRAMRKIGLVINHDKTYEKSNFRESCGGDFYNGVDVTPVRLKLSNANLPTSREITRTLYIESDNGILQLERHARELVRAGMHRTSELIYESLEASLGKLPTVSGDSPILGRYTLYPGYTEPCKFAFVPRAMHIASDKPCETKALGKWLWKHKGGNSHPPMPFEREVAGTSSTDVSIVSLPRKVYLKKVRVDDPSILRGECVQEKLQYIQAGLAGSSPRTITPSWTEPLSSVIASFYAVLTFAMKN